MSHSIFMRSTLTKLTGCLSTTSCWRSGSRRLLANQFDDAAQFPDDKKSLDQQAQI
jgi:hypothetical protein